MVVGGSVGVVSSATKDLNALYGTTSCMPCQNCEQAACIRHRVGLPDMVASASLAYPKVQKDNERRIITV
jgi:hypothetical protein